MDDETFREAATATIDDIITYNNTIESRPVVSQVQPGYLSSLIPPTAPENPEPWPQVQADLESAIMPGITHWQSPRFMAFFPASTSYPGLLADMWSNALTGAHFNWICSPAVTELETIVMDWLGRAINLPHEFLSVQEGEKNTKENEDKDNCKSTRGGGVIQGSASESILVCMVAARERYLGERVKHLPAEEQEEERHRLKGQLVAVASGSTHSSTKKAAQILGLRFVTVPVDEQSGWKMDGTAFAAKIGELRERKLEPFYATVTYGTTDTCAFDDLAGIVSINLSPSSHPPIWLHVDAAYAGSALICPEYQTPTLTAALAQYDSFNFNPHKWMLVSFDCSALWVRRRRRLIDAFSITPPYLRNTHSDDGLVTDYRDWQVPLGRRFRSLKLWFVMRVYGLEGLRAHIRKGVRLGEVMAGKLQSRPDLFRVVTGPRMGLVTFTMAARGETRRLYEAANASGEVYLTCTTLGEQFIIRVCTSVAAVEEEHVERTFALLVKLAEDIISSS